MCSKGKMDESLCVHSSRIRYLRLVAFLQELKKKGTADERFERGY